MDLLRTDSSDPDFISLVRLLDAELAIRDGEDHAFYAQFNHIQMIRHVLLVYEGDTAVACGAIKEYDDQTMEVKRMFTLPSHRSKGIASLLLKELEGWAADLGYKKLILETGIRQPEAIHLYKKNDYLVCPNYGQYSGVENSVCFEKRLVVLLFAICFFCCSCGGNSGKKTDDQKPVQALTAPAADPLDSLSAYAGKYPSSSGLWAVTHFTERIETLLGVSWYAFLRSHWQVEEPVTVEKNIFSVSACEAHNCSATNAIIVYDLQKRKFSVGIRQNGEIKKWSEDGMIPAVMEAWINQP